MICTLFMLRRKSIIILGEACGIFELRNSSPSCAASLGTQYSASSYRNRNRNRSAQGRIDG
jgi:hypothetical protein